MIPVLNAMLPSITLKAFGFEQLADDLGRIGGNFRSFHEPLQESVRKVVIPSLAENFASEGRPSWKPLSDSTVKKRGTAHPILDETGKLRRVATSESIWRITRDEASIARSSVDGRVSYAVYHQDGTKNMPARPIFGFQSEDVAGIEQVFSNWLDRTVDRYWGAGTSLPSASGPSTGGVVSSSNSYGFRSFS